MTPEALQKHRQTMELLGRLAAPNEFVRIKNFTVNGIPCERVRDKKRRGASPCLILYAHGGGYVSGGLSYAQILAAKMALETDCDVISFEYRLAPEHKYPSQLEDALSVWNRMTGRGYTADRILLAGDSAGGNLALCLAQSLIAGRGIRPAECPRALILYSPWTDMVAMSSSYALYKDTDPILTRSFVEECAAAYIDDRGLPKDPEFSPINGSFAGFPPTLIQVGRNEILLDDSVRLAALINAAGGDATLDIEEDGWHVYQQMPILMAAHAMKRVGEFVRRL